MTSQTTFRDAVLDADRPVPADLQDATGAPAAARFSVYRNNVVVSLSEALATGFPLVEKLLGPQTFQRLAGVFVRAHPPASPLMMHYGQALPDFLEHFEPLAHIGYLADCARLDLAFRLSYHAADAQPLDPQRLAGAPEEVMALRLTCAPATLIIRSSWPLYDIWRYNTETDAPKPRAQAQDVLITRQAYDPAPHLLAPGGATWLDALDRGQSLSDASETATNADADFDLSLCLTQALETAAFQDPKTKDT